MQLLALSNEHKIPALSTIGLKFVHNPQLSEQFIKIENDWKEFDKWFDNATDFGKIPLSSELRKKALEKNEAIVKQAKVFADALGMETKVVKLINLWDIPETTALEIINVDHPYFQELKKEFPRLRITYEPLRSFLSGGIRGMAGLSEKGEHIHLLDFPLFITDKIIHEILIHEVSHLKRIKKEMELGDIYKNGKLLDTGGYIKFSYNEKPIQFYPEGFSFDELTAYLISIEETYKYYKWSFEIPAELPQNHPLRILLNREMLEKKMASRIKILDDLIKPATRITNKAYREFKRERSFSPLFVFKGEKEEGLFYLTGHSFSRRLVAEEILASAVEKNLKEKLFIIEQVAKRAFATQNEFEQLKKTSH